MSEVPNYKSDGLENLRANETFRESPGPQSTPGGGTPAGGLENKRANEQTFRDAPKKTPTGGTGPTPPQHFTDDCV